MYMGFSRACGPAEGAVLIFANTARQARAVGFRGMFAYITDEYTDVGVLRLRGKPWLEKQARSALPHVIEEPEYCKTCMTWGGSEIDKAGLCDDCRKEAEEWEAGMDSVTCGEAAQRAKEGGEG